MPIAHVLRTTADRLRLEAHPYAREGMTPTQVRKYPTSRTWCIESPLGRTGAHETAGKYDGPTLVVVGGHHGDEPAGHIAAGLLARHAVADAGRLVVIPNANPSAIEVFSRYGQQGGESDLNRCYQVPGDARDAYCAGTLHASAILATVLALGPVAVVDLHETSYRHAAAKLAGDDGASGFWCFADTELDRLIARDVGIPVLHAPVIPTAFTGCTSRAGIASLAIETRDDLSLGARVRLHVAAVLTIAARVGLSISMPAHALDVFPPEAP